ncbi:zinc finger protein 267-like isoform X2 [Acanthochromis polyacanthus]|uniref:zinc finger protein 267-like isoform X2 n=1 Tax=Acanthochromis polyacanthus TaxID=80966 RepID=UPI002233EB4A|nr:zinc finger protein 267-like isoform X2 [Acanthochromis polyacanthus]
MGLIQNLRHFINERLTAAAEGIFTEFEKIIVQYEEEIDHQRRLLDAILKPQIKLHRIDLPQQHVRKEKEVLAAQQLCNEVKNYILYQEDPEPPQMKEEQEDLCTSPDQEDPETPQSKEEQEPLCTIAEVWHVQHLDITGKPIMTLHTTDFPRQDVCMEERFLSNKPPCNEDISSSLYQKDPKTLQVKEEQEELCTRLYQEDQEATHVEETQEKFCTSQEQEQLVPKQQTETFVVTSYQESDHSGSDPNSNQLLSYNLHAVECPDQGGSKHVDSGSTKNAELNPKKKHHYKKVDNPAMPERHCDTDTDRKCKTCDVCGRVFKYNHHLRKHYTVHTGVKPLACQTCGKGFTENYYLNMHMRIHTGETPYLCTTCGKKFSDPAKFKHHTEIHTSQNGFACKTCGKCFNHSKYLKAHMKTHSAEKRYSCKTCGKSFAHKCSLTIHMRIHTGDKPHICNTCGKCFSRSDHLSHHIRTHTEEKPYPCNTGGKRFRVQTECKKHAAIHTRENKTCGGD